ncbi:hypothetical protein ACFVAQ_45080 [Streptomyces sp. NPDC057651]|uniref:hypothetical protein n=1 Tax=Streptomyces sp. NPDC057651 TaxID=3346194 RepID=UPI00367B6071
MPRTEITAQSVSAAVPLAAVTLGAVDSTNGNQWRYTGRRKLLVRNGAATAITVTIRSNTRVGGLTVPDRTLSVPAGATAYVPEGPEALQVDGLVYCDWSSGTTVTAALIEDTSR